MKTRTVMGLLTLAAAGLLVLVAPGQTQPAGHEAVLKDMLATLGDINKTLKTVKDEETATAARPPLRDAAKKLLALRKLADSLKQPEKQEKDRLEAAYKVKIEDALKTLQNESIRVKAIPGGFAAVQEIAVATRKKKQ